MYVSPNSKTRWNNDKKNIQLKGLYSHKTLIAHAPDDESNILRTVVAYGHKLLYFATLFFFSHRWLSLSLFHYCLPEYCYKCMRISTSLNFLTLHYHCCYTLHTSILFCSSLSLFLDYSFLIGAFVSCLYCQLFPLCYWEPPGQWTTRSRPQPSSSKASCLAHTVRYVCVIISYVRSFVHNVP